VSLTIRLITRRSRVQIPPPPPREGPGQRTWAFVDGRVTGALYRVVMARALTSMFAPAEPVDVYRLTVPTRRAKRLAAAALIPGRTCW
jgi:hypothetical protein